jgi:hypothetical protein
MRITAKLLVPLLLLLPTSAQALDPELIFDRVSPSVWTVRSLDAQNKPFALGSAVVIAPGKLVTNCHVLAKAKSIQISKDKVTHTATLEFPDPERDLCQIAVSNLTAPTVALGAIQNLKIGQRVYAIGNPRGLELTMSEGIISSLRGGKDGSPLIQTTAAISQGSSGGGLFDTEGRLIGITTFSARDSQNLNFAHPVDWVTELPERGAAILARRGASEAASASLEPPAKTFPRMLLNDELSKHIWSLGRVQTKLPGVDWIQFSYARSITARGQTSQSPSGQTVVGTYKLNNSDNTICITMLRPNMNSDSSAVLFISGCYNVIQTAAMSYTLQSTTEKYEIPYDLPR